MRTFRASVFLSLFCIQLQGTPAFADPNEKKDESSFAEPAWTLKIPKGRYPCICDPPIQNFDTTDTFSIRQDSLIRTQQSQLPPLTWKRWEQRIVKALDRRVQSCCQARTHLKLYPLFCKVSFDVTRDGEIKAVRSTDSGVIMFDTLVYDAIGWLKGSDLLPFPEKSQEIQRTITAEFSNFPTAHDRSDSALKDFLDGNRQQYNGFDARFIRHD